MVGGMQCGKALEGTLRVLERVVRSMPHNGTSASGPHLSILISHAYPSLASPYFVVRSFSDLTPFLVIKENSIATSSATVCTTGVCAYPMRANKHGA